MSQEKLQEILELPVDEKLEIYKALVADLYSEESAHAELSENDLQELNRRIHRVESGEAELIAWEAIKSKYGF